MCFAFVSIFISSIVTLLLLVWTILGDHNKSAKVLSIDKKGFEFELTNRSGVLTVERYEFDDDAGKELADVGAVREEVAVLQTKAKVAVLPVNAGVFLSVLLWLILMCGSAETEGIGSKYVQGLRAVSQAVLGSGANAKIAMCVMLLAHGCEALYVWSLMTRMQLCGFSKASWCAMVVLLGYPITAQVMFLSNYSKKQQSLDSAGSNCRDEDMQKLKKTE